MTLMDFHAFPQSVNLGIFGCAAALVSVAGTWLASFFLADAVYRGGPILAATDQSALFAAAMGMVVTSIYLLGLLERRTQTIFRMGYDSFGVLVTYAAGIVGLYFLR
jgi:cation:H+ antiporter